MAATSSCTRGTSRTSPPTPCRPTGANAATSPGATRRKGRDARALADLHPGRLEPAVRSVHDLDVGSGGPWLHPAVDGDVVDLLVLDADRLVDGGLALRGIHLDAHAIDR